MSDNADNARLDGLHAELLTGHTVRPVYLLDDPGRAEIEAMDVGGEGIPERLRLGTVK